MDYSPTELEAFVRERAPKIAEGIQQAAAKADWTIAVTDACQRRTQEMTRLLAEADRTANALADACLEAAVLDDDWARRIALLAEENRRADGVTLTLAPVRI